jgi:hypothetical protein
MANPNAFSAREAERQRAQRQQLLQHSLDDDKVLTFAEWCKLNKIGQRTGRRIIGSGNGPIVTQLSERRIGITVGNNRRWQAARARQGG